MKIISSLILTLAIIAGQLIKIPVGGNGGGATLLDVTVLAFCLIGLSQIKLHFLKPPLFVKSGLLFSFIALISLILTPLTLTVPQYLSSSLYIIRFSSVLFLSWLLVSKVFPSVKQNINHILLISGTMLAVLGLWQFILLPDLRFLAVFGWDPHYYRTASTFLDPNFAGAFFVLTLLLLTSFNQISSLYKQPKVFRIMFSLIYLALLTTFSRSSYLMFLVSFLVFSLLKKSIKMAVVTIVLFAFLLLSFQIYIRAVNRVTPLDRGQTASLRLSTWQQGFEIFLKNPVLGVGFNAYNFALRQYRLGDEQFLQGKGSTTNDSSLLHILSTTGILGLLAYFWFIFGLLKTTKPILTAAVFGLLIHSFFVNSLFYPFILVWLILVATYSYDSSSSK